MLKLLLLLLLGRCAAAASAMLLPCFCCAAMLLLCCCYAAAMLLLCCCAVALPLLPLRFRSCSHAAAAEQLQEASGEPCCLLPLLAGSRGATKNIGDFWLRCPDQRNLQDFGFAGFCQESKIPEI